MSLVLESVWACWCTRVSLMGVTAPARRRLRRRLLDRTGRDQRHRTGGIAAGRAAHTRQVVDACARRSAPSRSRRRARRPGPGGRARGQRDRRGAAPLQHDGPGSGRRRGRSDEDRRHIGLCPRRRLAQRQRRSAAAPARASPRRRRRDRSRAGPAAAGRDRRLCHAARPAAGGAGAAHGGAERIAVAGRRSAALRPGADLPRPRRDDLCADRDAVERTAAIRRPRRHRQRDPRQAGHDRRPAGRQPPDRQRAVPRHHALAAAGVRSAAARRHRATEGGRACQADHRRLPARRGAPRARPRNRSSPPPTATSSRPIARSRSRSRRSPPSTWRRRRWRAPAAASSAAPRRCTWRPRACIWRRPATPTTLLATGRLQYAPLFTTDLHKFSVHGLAIDYRASGTVNGHLGWDTQRKPYRLGEHNGDLARLDLHGRDGLGARRRRHVGRVAALARDLDRAARIDERQDAGDRRNPAQQQASRAAGQGRRAGARRALHRRTRLSGHVPHRRSVVRARPGRPRRPARGRLARGAGLLRLSVSADRRAAVRRRSRRRRKRPARRRQARPVRRRRCQPAEVARHAHARRRRQPERAGFVEPRHQLSAEPGRRAGRLAGDPPRTTPFDARPRHGLQRIEIDTQARALR